MASSYSHRSPPSLRPTSSSTPHARISSLITAVLFFFGPVPPSPIFVYSDFAYRFDYLVSFFLNTCPNRPVIFSLVFPGYVPNNLSSIRCQFCPTWSHRLNVLIYRTRFRLTVKINEQPYEFRIRRVNNTWPPEWRPIYKHRTHGLLTCDLQRVPVASRENVLSWCWPNYTYALYTTFLQSSTTISINFTGVRPGSV